MKEMHERVLGELRDAQDLFGVQLAVAILIERPEPVVEAADVLLAEVGNAVDVLPRKIRS